MESIEGEDISSDENDIFQCGKCKAEFFSLSLFKSHKLTKCRKSTKKICVIPSEEHLSPQSYNSETISSKEISDENLENQNEECTSTIISTDDILSPIIKKSYYENNAVQVISVNGIIHLSASMDENEIVNSVSSLFSRTNNSVQPDSTIEDGIITSIKSDMLLPSESVVNILPAVKTEELVKEENQNYNHELFHGSLAKPVSKSESSRGKISQKCSYCGREFVKNFDLQQHIRSHTGEKPFQCIVCGRSFAQKSNVKKHMETHKVWPSESLTHTLPKEPIKKVVVDDRTEEIMFDDSYVCHFCGMSLNSYIELRSHMKAHADKKVYKCIQLNCEETFEEMDIFIDHVKQHGKETQFRCHTCSKSFDSLQSLGSHQIEHSVCPNSKKKAGESYFRCTLCLNKYSSAEAFDYHLRNTTHHFPCTHCSKIYSSERLLRRHLHVHGKTNLVSCSTCKKEFKNIYTLKLHLLTHTGEKAFKCQICNACFYRKDGLKRHTMVHYPKKIRCPFRIRLGCMSEFRRTDKLRVHMVSHFKANKRLSSVKNKRLSGSKSKRENFSITISVDSKTDDITEDLSRNGSELDQNLLGDCENIEIIESSSEEVKAENQVGIFEEGPIYEHQLIDDQKLSRDTLSDFAYDGEKKYEIVQIPFDQTWETRSLEEGNVVIHDDSLAHASAIFSGNGQPFVASEIADLSLFVTPHVDECASIELSSKDVSWNESS